MNQELENMASEVNSKIRSELFDLAGNPKVGVWVDSNVMMYARNDDKMKLLGFPVLRTVPEVAIEVRKKSKATSYLLDDFLRVGGELVGPDSRTGALALLYNLILNNSCSYSPLTQNAIVENIRRKGTSSPIANNALADRTASSSFLPSFDETGRALAAATGGEDAHDAACEKVRNAWFKYHREREQRLAAKSYIWTDEKLVSSAITDGFANKCISVILTTDWDPFVIIKQFVDNVIYHSVTLETASQEGDAVFDALYDQRCRAFDDYNEKRRWQQSTAILDGELFKVGQPANLFIWHYPTEVFLSFAFNKDFKSWLSAASISQLEKKPDLSYDSED